MTVYIELELGREILFSDEPSYQLYAGHRGAGKSTELLRLKSYLEANDCFVVYFAADEEDIDSDFWIGLYGLLWLESMSNYSDLAYRLMMLKPHKRLYFQKGFMALSLIQSIV